MMKPSVNKVLVVVAFLICGGAVPSLATALGAQPEMSPEARSAPGVAQPSSSEEKIQGVWTGQMSTSSGTVTSVVLKISTPLQPGTVSASLVYGGQRLCSAQGRYEGTRGERTVFSLSSRDGGVFCDKLRQLQVWPTSDQEVSYQTSSDDKRTESGMLKKEIRSY